MPKLAIVGAGVAGCATAWALRAAGLEVVLFEKSRGVSGRAATRRRDGVAYDHGANYFKTENPRVAAVIHDELPTAELAQIEGDVWTFDGAGQISPGDPAQNASAKWTYRSGLNTLGKLLLGQTTARLHRQCRIARLDQHPDGWHLFDTEDAALGRFDAVLLTPPAPQSLELLAASRIEGDLRDALEGGLEAATYRSQFSIILAYDRHIARPGAFFGLVNTDGAHDVAWLSFEHDKPGHVPEGQRIVVVQMAPAWTLAHYEDAPEDLVRAAAEYAGTLLGEDLRNPTWTDHQRWRYALPDAGADAEALTQGHAAGLFVAGDALAGKGRVEAALASGLEVADEIRERLIG